MFYRIAELDVEIIFSTSDFNNSTLIPSFSPFTISEKEKNDGIFFRLYVTTASSHAGREENALASSTPETETPWWTASRTDPTNTS